MPGTITFQDASASNLANADRFSTSDPYVKWSTGTAEVQTEALRNMMGRTVSNTPSWDSEEYSIKYYEAAGAEVTVTVSVWDMDKGADDLLGEATVTVTLPAPNEIAEKDFTDAGFPCIICAHIADGNFHCCIPYQPEEKARVQEIEHRMIDRALAYEGTVSGEHGVGVGKIAHIIAEHGEDQINVQRSIKRALDPKNIMNPGKIFILPRKPGGCCDIPAVYHESDAGGAGTYSH